MAEMVSKCKKAERIQFIEGLRAIASICVFNTHILSVLLDVTGYLESKIILLTPISLLHSGGFGVSYFFFISGFGLYLSMDKKSVLKVVLNILKRYFRLVPIILLSNLLCWVLMKFGLYYIDNGGFPYIRYDLGCTIWRPFKEAFWGVFNGYNSFSSPFWTAKPQFKGIILASILLIVEFRLPHWARVGINAAVMFVLYLLKLDACSYEICLVAGTVCYEFVHICLDEDRISKFIKQHKAASYFCTILFIEFIVLWQRIGNVNTYLDYTYLCWLPWVILFPVLIIADRDMFKNIFENKYLVRLGGYSFAIYGVHTVIWNSLGYIMLNRTGGHPAIIEAILIYMCCCITTLFMAVIISVFNDCFQKKVVDPMFSFLERGSLFHGKL